MPEDVPVAPAGRTEHDDLGAAPIGLLDDRTAGVARAHHPLNCTHAVGRRDRARLVEQQVGFLELLTQVGVERQLERDDDHAQEDDSPDALGGKASRDLHSFA